MDSNKLKGRNRAQESTNAIERLYITMRHLFNRGFYKPMGVSGESLRQALLLLKPEIYGSVAEEKAELKGLTYVLDRLPLGIEQCRHINLTSDEGYSNSHFKPIIPSKRRRNCYRIDKDQMNIEITRGRSDIYDILTHLTFLFIEAQKICKKMLVSENGDTALAWQKLEWAVNQEELSVSECEVTLTHITTILGRTFQETQEAHFAFATKENEHRFLHIVYWLGKLTLDEEVHGLKRTVTFSPVLRERLGHHIHGELWASTIKKTLEKARLIDRPVHIISANMHSVMNSIYLDQAVGKELDDQNRLTLFESLSQPKNASLRKKIEQTALKNGMIYIEDQSGANINVQIFDTSKIDFSRSDFSISDKSRNECPVILVMDYAFGEQAYESIDELLKPYKNGSADAIYLKVESVSVMGKAGILEGSKGDIMIPSAHIFEGTADNYPFKNELCEADFKGYDLKIFEGSMVTVLGTSLQNKDLLTFFLQSTWNVVGLEMEGAHYQKAIQSASRIRKSISPLVKVRYAYYASDNPLETGSTLASGGLGVTGVKPVYLITKKILEQIFNDIQ